MSTIHLHQTTTATPEQFLAGLTDFGPGREKLFGNSSDSYLKVHDQGPDYADVTEGSGGVWERLHYDWSDPQRVVMTTTDSNIWGGRSGHVYTFTRKPNGTTDVDAVVVREGKNVRGRLLGAVLGSVGKSKLEKAFANTGRAIENRNHLAPFTATTPDADDSSASSNTMRVYVARGLVAIVWAVVFAVAAHSLTTGVTLGAGILLVAYPLIDVIGSLNDARTQHGPARRLLLANAASSTLAAVALAVAATGSVAAVLAVFGVWAVLSGAAQLVVALRRRRQFGLQLPMVLAGGVSVILGVGFVFSAASGNPRLSMLAVYAATGGIDFVIQAWLLARRRRHVVTPAAEMLQAA